MRVRICHLHCITAKHGMPCFMCKSQIHCFRLCFMPPAPFRFKPIGGLWDGLRKVFPPESTAHNRHLTSAFFTLVVYCMMKSTCCQLRDLKSLPVTLSPIGSILLGRQKSKETKTTETSFVGLGIRDIAVPWLSISTFVCFRPRPATCEQLV
jgi:hypothetical protein